MTHPDDAGRRLSEALHAQASRGPVPPGGDRSRPPRQAAPPPPPPPRVPGRAPPPAPRPAQTAPPAPPTPQAPGGAAGSDGRQIAWALIVTLLVGAILGGGLALVSVLLPGALPAIG